MTKLPSNWLVAYPDGPKSTPDDADSFVDQTMIAEFDEMAVAWIPEMFNGVFSTVTVTGVAVALLPLASTATTVIAYEPSATFVVLQVVEHAPDVIRGPTSLPPT